MSLFLDDNFLRYLQNFILVFTNFIFCPMVLSVCALKIIVTLAKTALFLKDSFHLPVCGSLRPYLSENSSSKMFLHLNVFKTQYLYYISFSQLLTISLSPMLLRKFQFKLLVTFLVSIKFQTFCLRPENNKNLSEHRTVLY
jgi:hypothetical protein